MTIVERAWGLLSRPRETWLRIAAKPSSPRALFLGYAAILALIPPVADVLAETVLARKHAGIAGTPLASEMVQEALRYLFGLALLFGISQVAGFFAPRFGGRRDPVAAMKLIVHAATPVWILGLLAFVPGIELLTGAIGLLWAIYLIFLGVPAVLGVPPRKAGGFTGVVTLIWLIGYLAISGLASLFASVIFPQSY